MIQKRAEERKKVLLSTALVVGLFIGGIVLAFAWQNSQSNQSEPETDSEAAQIDTTRRETTTPSPSITPTPTPSAEPAEEKELTIPPTTAQIKSFFPEGITSMHYWYENMDGEPGYEVVVAYSSSRQARLAVLAGKEDLYHVQWDVDIPGQSISALEVGDRNDDDVTELTVTTIQTADTGFVNLLQYTPTGPEVLILKGGEKNGENTKISFWNSEEALSTSQVYQVVVGDQDGDGKDEINILSGPRRNLTDTSFEVTEGRYEWDGETYSFQVQGWTQVEI